MREKQERTYRADAVASCTRGAFAPVELIGMTGGLGLELPVDRDKEAKGLALAAGAPPKAVCVEEK